MAQKQYVSRWLIDMLADGPYRDEREVKAEQRQIRENARSEVDAIWDKAQRDLTPPAPVVPLAPPSWGTPPLPPPPAPDLVPAPPPDLVGADPGIGAVSRLAEPLPPPPPPAPITPAPAAPDYWAGPVR